MNGNQFIAFDIETTGFSPVSNRITEIGAVKIKNGKIIAEFNQLINPGTPIPWRITEITGITTEMVKDKPMIDDVLPCFFQFCNGCSLVAHNANFDMGFIRANARKLGLACDFHVIDTLEICRNLFRELDNHKLDTISYHLNVKLHNHHRALADARAVANIFLHCTEILAKKYYV